LATKKTYSAADYEKAYGLRPATYLPFPQLAIPENTMTLIYGNKGVGKSTLALGIAKQVAENSKVLFIDSETGVSPTRLVDLQINPKNFFLRHLEFVEELYELLTSDEVLKYDLVVIDGLGSLGFIAESENSANSANIGVKARILNKMFRLIINRFYDNGVTSIFINHERPMIDGMGHYLPGGQGQLNASSHTLRLYTTSKGRFQKNKKVAGQYINVKVEKSRFISPFQQFKLKLHFLTAEIEDVTND